MGVATGRFEREGRLLRSEEFRDVARYGRRARAGGFLLIAASQGVEVEGRPPRLGVTVGRHVGKAVVRNRLKRWIREWFRDKRSLMQPDLDVVVVARDKAAGISHREATKSLDAGAQAVGLLV